MVTRGKALHKRLDLIDSLLFNMIQPLNKMQSHLDCFDLNSFQPLGVTFFKRVKPFLL